MGVMGTARRTHLPRPLELEDLAPVLVDLYLGVLLCLEILLARLNSDEQERADAEREWCPLGRGVLPCRRQSFFEWVFFI
jgi:hypothetical protein